MKTNGLLFIVEGNIGAGKSSFLEIAKTHLSLDIIPEPVFLWQKTNGNILKLFYNEMSRWAYTFQSNVLFTRLKNILDHESVFQKNTTKLLERSVYCDRYCFAKNCFELGMMTPLEWELYKETFALLTNTFMPKPDGFIYLRADPTTCYQRIQKRSRSEEKKIPLSYVEQLHNKHEEWLRKKSDLDEELIDIPTLTLDCNNDFENSTTKKHEFLSKVEHFVKDRAASKALKKSL